MEKTLVKKVPLAFIRGIHTGITFQFAGSVQTIFKSKEFFLGYLKGGDFC